MVRRKEAGCPSNTSQYWPNDADDPWQRGADLDARTDILNTKSALVRRRIDFCYAPGTMSPQMNL
jgi:hypothetical protein